MVKLNRIKTEKTIPVDDNVTEELPFEPFYFVQAADSQFGLIERWFKHIDPPGFKEETELCEKFVEACNKMDNPKPKFAIVCGDLIDAQPLEATRGAQLAEFERIFSKLDKDIPLVCVCGNHDVGDVPTEEAVEGYKKEFGEDYFYFVVNKVLFIVINSQFYENRQFVEGYAREQDVWLEKILTKCKNYKYTILFQHIPWFLKTFDEEDEYFNINRATRLHWLKKFYEAGVNKIMCGHYHRNAGGWYDKMELVVTSAIGAQFGSDKSGARIVRVLDDQIDHKYYALEDLPEHNPVDV